MPSKTHAQLREERDARAFMRKILDQVSKGTPIHVDWLRAQVHSQFAITPKVFDQYLRWYQRSGSVTINNGTIEKPRPLELPKKHR